MTGLLSPTLHVHSTYWSPTDQSEQPQAFAALRVALELQVFEHFEAGTQEQTVEDLAKIIGAEPLLLGK